MKKRFPGINCGARGSNFKDKKDHEPKVCFDWKKPGHFVVDCLDLKKDKCRVIFRRSRLFD